MQFREKADQVARTYSDANCRNCAEMDAFLAGARWMAEQIADEYEEFHEKHRSYIVGDTIGPLFVAGYNEACASFVKNLQIRSASLSAPAAREEQP